MMLREKYYNGMQVVKTPSKPYRSGEIYFQISIKKNKNDYHGEYYYLLNTYGIKNNISMNTVDKLPNKV